MFIESRPPELTGSDDLLRLRSVKIDFPARPTQVNFVFGEHDTAEQLPPTLGDMVEASDVILIEQLVQAGDSERLNALSMGDKAALHQEIELANGRPDKTYSIALAEALFDTHKPIKLPDVQASRKVRQLHAPYLNPGPEAYRGVRSTDDLIRAQGRIYRGLCEHVLFARDKHFLNVLYPTLTESFPEAPRQSTTALFVIGAVHRVIPHVIRERLQKQPEATNHAVSETYYGNTDTPLHDLYKSYLQKIPFTERDIMRYQLLRNPSLGDISLTDPALRAISTEELRDLFDKNFAHIFA